MSGKYVKKDIKELIWEIKQKIDLVDVLDMYGIEQGKQRHFYHCPFHGGDKNPSASIERGVFHCFTCNKSWDLISIVQEMEKTGLYEAIKIIDDKFNLNLFKHLSYEEKKDIYKRQKERRQKKLQEDRKKNFEKNIVKVIIANLEIEKEKENKGHPTKREVRTDTWSKEKQQLFFSSVKKQQWLSWLYAKVCDLDFEECEYDYLYQGLDKTDILRLLYKKEIKL